LGSGPLVGIKVLEFAGIGPGPFCAMLLSDLGADVLRIDRKGVAGAHPAEVVSRGRRSLALDLKASQDVDLARQLMSRADVVIEGFRPGVMERLGLGPEVALSDSRRLVYGRMTGWGQDGPWASAAGHDINYIALTGALAGIGPAAGPPAPPLNLVGDFGGGSLYLALGIVAALLETQRSGEGQVIDAAIVDGAASLMAIFSGLQAMGLMNARRGENFLDGSAHYYRCYECSDGRYVSIGAIEPQFYALLWRLLGDEAPTPHPPQDFAGWREAAEGLAAIFKRRSRDAWCELFAGTDVCFAPVMEFDEAPNHPHMAARGTFLEAFGVVQPAPAPRFSRTPGAIQGPPPAAGEGGVQALEDWGLSAAASDLKARLAREPT